MSPTNNPFRSRYTEMQRDRAGFLSTFSTTMLQALPDPDTAWNRLVVLRSAPGAGKTSILRMLTPSSLSALRRDTRDEHLNELKSELESRGVMTDGSPQLLGVMVSVGKDYRSLVDLGPQGPGALKIFFKLLDARVISRTIEASLHAAGLRFPEDAELVEFRPRSGIDGERANFIADTIFGHDRPALDGRYVLDGLRRKERTVISLLGSLMPVRWDNVGGHSEIFSLTFLASTSIFVAGALLDVRPLLLFDDVHDLDGEQRRSLYEALMVRESRVGRWIAERRSAVPLNELLVGTTQGRDYELVELEEHFKLSTRQRQIMTSIANSRAASPLASMGRSEWFSELLTGTDTIPPIEASRAAHNARSAAAAVVQSHPEYKSWLENSDRAPHRTDLERAVAYRELRILIERNLRRSAPTLFDLTDELPVLQAEKLASSNTRAAARLFLAAEEKLPYYAGPEVLAELSSRNIEQYLALAGDQFDLILSALLIRGRTPYLSASEQDSRIRRASRELWEAIPRRVPNGADVQSLLYSVAERGRRETFQANAPYAPGVTGVALEWSEARRLFRSRQDDERLEQLRQAFGHAVASNLLESTAQPRPVKNSQFQVFYLNRMLLPHFGLPLQRGGFREQTIVRTLESWARSAHKLGGLLPNLPANDETTDDRLL